MFRIILWIVSVVVVSGVSINVHNSSETFEDEFIKHNQKECYVTNRMVSCFKYRMAKIIWKLVTNNLGYFPNENSRMMDDKRRIRIVQLTEPSGLRFFTDSRSLQDDNEITRIIKFFKRAAELFARKHGIQIGITNESGTEITSGDTSVVEPRLRGEKKRRKWLIILPLIILMKMAHLKMTVVPLLLGVIGLNILLIGGGGWVIHYLKNRTLCKTQPHFIQTHSHLYESDPSEYSAIVGGSSYPGHNGGVYYTSHDGAAYAKDWSTNKAYSAYSGYRI